MCVCSLKHPACNVHAPYSHLWPVPLYSIFPHFLTKGTIFEKSYWTQNVCFDFLYKFVSNIFHSKKKWARYDQIYIYIYYSSCKVPFILILFKETLVFSTDFRKILKYHISWKSIMWKPSCSVGMEGQSDGKTWRSQQSLFAILRKRLKRTVIFSFHDSNNHKNRRIPYTFLRSINFWMSLYNIVETAHVGILIYCTVVGVYRSV